VINKPDCLTAPEMVDALTIETVRTAHQSRPASWRRRPRKRAAAIIASLAIGALVVAMAPLYVCMPPWVDTTFFDIIAKSVLAHEPVYRVYLLHGPPGMLLLQSAIRSLIGWSSEALRLLDLGFVAGIIICLARTVPQRRLPAVKLWTAFVLAYFYLGATTEWSHCQTDTWMLLPALTAFLIHQHRFLKSSDPEDNHPRPALMSPVLEGIAWGLAFTIKPFVVFPALACWFITTIAWHKLGRTWLTQCRHFAAMMTGGLIVGTAAVAWLYTTGSWQPFLEAAFSNWNRDYWANSPRISERPGLLFRWFLPWNLIHLVTVPASIAIIARFCVRSRAVRQTVGHSQLMLAAFYLGWFFQANALQRQLPYHLMPTILLAIPLLFGLRWSRLMIVPFFCLARHQGMFWNLVQPLTRGASICKWLIIAVFLAYSWTQQDAIRWLRLRFWRECWSEASTPLMRARLALEGDMAAPDWLYLDRVREFLAKQNLHDGELNCYAVSSLSLYLDLNIKPGNPYVYGWGSVQFFRHHGPEILQTMLKSPQRFIVNDYMQLGYSRQDARLIDSRYPLGRLPVPAFFRHNFPLDFPIQFRSGRYLVHVVEHKSIPATGSGSAPP
jgi:hypothetical protein